MEKDRVATIEWQLDLFSTFLSRKHSYHRMIGNLRFAKVKKERK